MEKDILKKSLVIGIISMMILLSIAPVPSSASNPEPSITITRPTEGHWYLNDQEYYIGTGVNIRVLGDLTVNADTDNDQDIAYVEFYIDDESQPKGTDFFKPYSWLYQDFSVGWHEIIVKARDASHAILATDSGWIIYFIRDWWNPDSPCFLAGTNITMADNSDKKIEDIVIGDKVKSYDIATDAYVEGKVTKVYHHKLEDMGDHYLIINDNIRVTPNHLLYINSVLMLAGDAQIGDLLGGSDVTIYSIQQVFDQVPTYNFEIESTTTGIESINMMYIAEELSAHPAKPGNLVNQVNEAIQQGQSSSIQTIAEALGAQYLQMPQQT